MWKLSQGGVPKGEATEGRAGHCCGVLSTVLSAMGQSSTTKGGPEVLTAPLWRAGPVRDARVELREVCRAGLRHTASEAPSHGTEERGTQGSGGDLGTLLLKWRRSRNTTARKGALS